MSDAERQLDGFIAKFSPENQTLIRELRAAMRRRMPTANELVYDNYNFFVIGYCATERPSDSILSLAFNVKGAVLSFYHGADLVDADGILLGSGNQNRFVRVESKATLARADVDALIEQAGRITKVPLPGTGGGKLIIRSISSKQRPRQ